MQLRLVSLKLTDFKAYAGTHTWNLPEQAGLFYITGQNKFNRRLGANGIGKSTLTDAINWILYGKTSRGLKASDVVSWGRMSCQAVACFLIGDEQFDIQRTQRPNKITINGEPANQDELSKLIRLNQEALNNSMLLPQFGNSFLDLSPTGKLAMFAQVMDLDYWLERSKIASDTSDEIENNIHSVKEIIAKLRGKIETLKSGFQSLRQKSAEFKINTEKQIKELQKEIKQIKSLHEAENLKLKKVERKLEQSRKDRDAAVKSIHKLREAVDNHRPKHATLQANIDISQRQIKELRAESAKAEKLEGSVCPTCHQVISKDHTRKHIKVLVQKEHKLEVIISNFQKDLKMVRVEMQRDTDAYHDASRAAKKAADLYNDLFSSVSKLRASSANLHNRCVVLDSKLSEIRKRSNPYKALIDSNLKERKTLIKRIANNRKILNDQRIIYEATSYWIKGFKRVRLFVIEEALTALEIEVNNLLISLGLIDWKITFDIERENKSGGVTKGFTVLIHSPKHSKPVKFESFSGGEIQRLRLAGDLGLSNLIMEQAGFENLVEIIDEPSEHLSGEGIEDLIETLAERAHETKKQIWLMDHSTINSAMFSGVLSCVMNKKGQASFTFKGG